jgi:predicted nuclease of predicted toxin-antitoxin system
MRVFLDACIDPRAADIFSGHEVRTAVELGWHRLKDHLLLNLVEEQFDVFVTIDRGFEHQHNLKNRRIGIVIVHVSNNKAASYRALAAELLSSVVEVRPRAVLHVPRL